MPTRRQPARRRARAELAAYIVHRSQADPAEEIFFEVYSDRNAFKAHTQIPHMAAFQGKLARLADLSTVKIDRMDRFAGFAR